MQKDEEYAEKLIISFLNNKFLFILAITSIEIICYLLYYFYLVHTYWGVVITIIY